MDKRRITLVAVVVAIIAVIGVLIGVFGPALVKSILELHGGG